MPQQKRHERPILPNGESLPTWEKCPKCGQFRMFTGIEWMHRNGIKNCKRTRL